MVSPQIGGDELGSLIDMDHATDRAVSALTRGDIGGAVSYSQTALRRDPKDPYALLIAGLAYQASGKFDLARQYFQVILTNQPVARIALPARWSKLLKPTWIKLIR